jgi:hypothetical protein
MIILKWSFWSLYLTYAGFSCTSLKVAVLLSLNPRRAHTFAHKCRKKLHNPKELVYLHSNVVTVIGIGYFTKLT